MKESYAKALAFVLAAEGNYSDDVGDSGGPTMNGLTWSDIAQWRGLPVSAVETHAQKVAVAKSLTQPEKEAIYAKRYWAPIQGDALPWPLDLMAFDTAVNCGIGTAVIMLHQSCGLATEKAVTPELLTRLNTEGTHLDRVVLNLLDIRRAYYRRIAQGHNARFLHGWLNRVDDLEKAIKQ